MWCVWLYLLLLQTSSLLPQVLLTPWIAPQHKGSFLMVEFYQRLISQGLFRRWMVQLGKLRVKEAVWMGDRERVRAPESFVPWSLGVLCLGRIPPCPLCVLRCPGSALRGGIHNNLSLSPSGVESAFELCFLFSKTGMKFGTANI